jgi:hypothetical protein
LTDAGPVELLKAFKAHDCVAFVGAGFSAPIDMPLWKKLLDDLISRIKKDYSGVRDLLEYAEKCTNEGQLARAAFLIREADRQHKGRIEQLLKEFFDGKAKFERRPAHDQKKIEMQARLDALASLPWTGYITTNYDTLISEYFPTKLRPNNICATPYDNLGAALKSSDRPFLVHLHGNIHNGPMILCEEDYDHAYLAAHSPLLSFLRAILLRYTVVFIGTQVEDRFVELRRQLNQLFSDMRPGKDRTPLPRDYVLLPQTEKLRASYLEYTGGFSVILYENNTGNHEGLLPVLRSLRDALARYLHQDSKLDKLNDKILRIVSHHPDGIALADISSEFFNSSNYGGADSPHEHSPSEDVFYRLHFLQNLGLVWYDETYDTYKALGNTSSHSGK